MATVTSRRTRRRHAAGWLIVALGLACQETAGPNGNVDGVVAIDVEAVSLSAVRVRWAPIGGAEVISYRLERRANFTGVFAVVAPSIPQSNATEIVYFDIGLEPETYYGYRVVAQSRFGVMAAPSLVRAAQTPPRPSVLVTTNSILATPAAGDPDGYMAFLRGPADSAGIPVGLDGQARFGPLTPGPYSVELRSIAGQCLIDGTPMRSAAVTDQGVHTVDTVRYVVACRDPGLGRITVAVDVAGDSLDATGYHVQLVGRPTLGPDSLVSRQFHVDAAGGQRTFDLLYPGPYEVSIDSIASHCALDGSVARNVTVGSLSDDTVGYAITCAGGGGGGSGPYVWRHGWSASTVPAGQRVSLDITLDLSANPAERVSTVQSKVEYNAGALRFDSAKAVGLGNGFVANGSTPGEVIWADYSFNPPGGLVTLIRLHFTATGATGTTSVARSTIAQLLAGDEATALDTLVRFVLDTVTVGGGGGGGNQAPVAEANGPYGGTTGNPVAFSASGSSDPDGTIASYSWTFGDGGSAPGASPSHTYTGAGPYTAVLTVTDNQGGTDTDQATVNITAPGQTTPFTWAGGFGTINPVDSVVALTLTLDLTSDIVETPGAEQLATYVVDSLKWNPAVLRFHAFNWGPGGAGVMNPTDAVAQGKLLFASFTMPAGNNSGVITIATIRFKVIGSPATATTTATFLGPLTGTAATGSYAYRPRTQIQEATIVVP